MDYLLHLDSFEGPLDLLLHLIEKNELDIYNIPVAEVTAQYMEYIEAMQELSLDIASEFLVMAATLVQIKSRMLLPRPQEPVFFEEEEAWEEETDLRQALIDKLVDYRKFKQLAQQLHEKEVNQARRYSRPPMDLTPYSHERPWNPVEDVSLFELLDAFQSVMRRAMAEEAISHVARDEISITDRMTQILSLLHVSREAVSFHQVIGSRWHRHEIVVTFLAVLELIKARKIRCYQDRLFKEIRLVAVNVEPAHNASEGA